MSKIHLEILDLERKQILQSLEAFKDTCYLAGGTALALQTGHRLSVDFDLFTPKPLSNILRKRVRDIFGDVRFYISSADQISFSSKNISITFLYYWFPLIKPKVATNSVPYASVTDIISDKAQTLGRRAVWRDYADIFYVLKNNLFSLEMVIENACKKFKGEFVKEQFLEQLVYFEDVEIVKIDWIKEQYTSSDIKSFLEKSVQNYMRKIAK